MTFKGWYAFKQINKPNQTKNNSKWVYFIWLIFQIICMCPLSILNWSRAEKKQTESIKIFLFSFFVCPSSYCCFCSNWRILFLKRHVWSLLLFSNILGIISLSWMQLKVTAFHSLYNSTYFRYLLGILKFTLNSINGSKLFTFFSPDIEQVSYSLWR